MNTYFITLITGVILSLKSLDRLTELGQHNIDSPVCATLFFLGIGLTTLSLYGSYKERPSLNKTIK
jgi:hypothetical protein